MGWGTSVRCGGSNSPWPRFAKLPESCSLLTRRTQSVCLKVFENKSLLDLSAHSPMIKLSIVRLLWCYEFLVNEANFRFSPHCLDNFSWNCKWFLFSLKVMPCSDVSWGLVCWMRARWSSITSWVWRLRISWRGGCRLRSSSLALPRASIMPVSLSARGTFGRLRKSKMLTRLYVLRDLWNS